MRRRTLMKKLSIKKGVQCMACLECVRACSNAYYKEFHPDKAALKIVQRGENVRPILQESIKTGSIRGLI